MKPDTHSVAHSLVGGGSISIPADAHGTRKKLGRSILARAADGLTAAQMTLQSCQAAGGASAGGEKRVARQLVARRGWRVSCSMREAISGGEPISVGSIGSRGSSRGSTDTVGSTRQHRQHQAVVNCIGVSPQKPLRVRRLGRARVWDKPVGDQSPEPVSLFGAKISQRAVIRRGR